MMTWLEVPEVMAALHIKTDKKGTEKNNLNYQGGSYPPYVPPVWKTTPFLEPFVYSKRSFCHDRLGTSIGKA